MRTIDEFSAGKAFGVAALLSGVNPKNLALNAAGVLVISQAGMSPVAFAQVVRGVPGVFSRDEAVLGTTPHG